jgi:hypothetical protein
MDLIVLDELGYLPFAQTGGQLLFHLVSRLYERTSAQGGQNWTPTKDQIWAPIDMPTECANHFLNSGYPQSIML